MKSKSKVGLSEAKKDQRMVMVNSKTCYHCQFDNICLVFAKLRDLIDVLPKIGVGGGSSEMMAIMGIVQANCNKFVEFPDDEG